MEFFSFFKTPKPAPSVIIIRNVLGEQIEKAEGCAWSPMASRRPVRPIAR